MSLEFDIGRHCCADNCRQLDFLPTICDECHLAFCQEHSTPQTHMCSKLDEIEARNQKALICKKCSTPYSSLLGHSCASSRSSKKRLCYYPKCKERGIIVEGKNQKIPKTDSFFLVFFCLNFNWNIIFYPLHFIMKISLQSCQSIFFHHILIHFPCYFYI